MRSIGRDEKPRLVFQEQRCINVAAFNCVALPNRYHRLPPSLLRLSVLKLDGSSFDVHIARTGSVAELKKAVEDIFFESIVERESNISWSHVWGHFCLCFNNRKLVDNKACIRSYGIKDGDKLHFVQHLSINNSPLKRQSKGPSAFSEQQTMFVSGSGSDVCKESKNKVKKDSNSDDQNENNRSQHIDNEAFHGDLIVQPQFKVAHYLKGWFSYTKLWQVGRTRSEGKVHPWRLPGL